MVVKILMGSTFLQFREGRKGRKEKDSEGGKEAVTKHILNIPQRAFAYFFAMVIAFLQLASAKI